MIDGLFVVLSFVSFHCHSLWQWYQSVLTRAVAVIDGMIVAVGVLTSKSLIYWSYVISLLTCWIVLKSIKDRFKFSIISWIWLDPTTHVICPTLMLMLCRLKEQCDIISLGAIHSSSENGIVGNVYEESIVYCLHCNYSDQYYGRSHWNDTTVCALSVLCDHPCFLEHNWQPAGSQGIADQTKLTTQLASGHTSDGFAAQWVACV